MIGKKLDEYIQEKVKEYLDKTKFPDYDDVHTDTFSELLDKLTIVHIRYWYLEDAMSKAKTDGELSELRRKSESLFKEKRPMLVQGLDKIILKLIHKEHEYKAINVKKYEGWENIEKGVN